MNIFLNDIDLIANIVICGLWLTLGFFISAVWAESKRARFQERMMKEVASMSGKTNRTSEDTAELERLRGEVAGQLDAMKLKDQEISKLIEQVHHATEDRAKLEAHLTESFGEKSELGRLTSELNRLRTQLESKADEVPAAGVPQRTSEDQAELERLRGEVASQLEAMKLKDREIEKMIEQMHRESEDRAKLEAQLTESFSEKGELGRLNSELNRIRAELQTKTEEMKTKDQELMKLQEERRTEADRTARAEKILADYGQFEKTIQDQRKSFYEVEQRIREVKIKLRVITEKAKENVELIAAFSQGEGFDEFRKSIHVDELSQKYHDQIKDQNETEMPGEKDGA